jgi:proteic killer suppression protein
MIKSWKHAELKTLFETGKARRIDTKLQKRCIARLTALDSAKDLRDLYGMSGYELHKWSGYDTKWSISVSGHWRITFDWIKGEAYNVDLEQPHG